MTAGNSRTPFLSFESFVAEQTPVQESPRFIPARSPFVSVYEYAEGEAGIAVPEREAYTGIVAELYDEEFDEALFELLTEARGIHQEHLASGGNPSDAERLLTQHFAQLNHEADAMIDAIGRRVSASEYQFSEHEFDSFLDGYAPSTQLAPAFDHFLGKLVKKVGSAVKKVAGKAVQVATKLGLGPILDKVKALVKPLLDKVLQKAIGKLPVVVQPAARALAVKLGLAKPAEPVAPVAEPAGTPAPEDSGGAVQDVAGQNVTEMQMEFDAQLAEAMLADDEVELNLEIARLRASANAASIPVFAELDQAREQFIDDLRNLREGEDPQPYIQNFLPAVLPALKIGIRLIGRPKVVNFLAQFVARLIGKLIGPAQAPALSQAIVDSGLKLLNLEMTENERNGLAASAIAATVEETAARVASLPDHVLENDELLEGFALEAFEQAAASNLPAIFPPSVYKQRPDLLEGGVNAGWVLMPFRGPKRYKRCSRTFTVKITPQMAEELETFEGAPLAEVLQDQMGMPEGNEIEAEVHLYEALPGTTAGDIARYETGTPGLGAADAASIAQLHPLTREAAGTLLGRAALGRKTPPGTAHRGNLFAGQRLYHLAIPGKRPLTVPGAHGSRQIRRLIRLRALIDCSQNQVQVRFFISEVKAQKLAVKMRQQAHAGALAVAFNKLLTRRLAPILRGQYPRALRVVHNAVPPGSGAEAAWRKLGPAVVDPFISRLQESLIKGFSEFVQTQSQKFVKAVEEPADGVTMVFTIDHPQGLRDLCNALAGRAASGAAADSSTTAVRIDVFAGHQRG